MVSSNREQTAINKLSILMVRPLGPPLLASGQPNRKMSISLQFRRFTESALRWKENHYLSSLFARSLLCRHSWTVRKNSFFNISLICLTHKSVTHFTARPKRMWDNCWMAVNTPNISPLSGLSLTNSSQTTWTANELRSESKPLSLKGEPPRCGRVGSEATLS